MSTGRGWAARDYEVITTESGQVNLESPLKPPRRSLHRYLVDRKAALLHKFESAFRSLGSFIFDHAKFVIGCSFFVVCLCSVALLFIRFETRADLLYALPASQARSDLAKLVSLYGTPARANMIFVVHKDGNQILTPSVLRKVKKLDDFVKTELSIPPLRKTLNKKPSERVTYEDVCHRMNLPEADFSAVSDLDWDLRRRRRRVLGPVETSSAPCYSLGPIDLYRNEKQFGVPLATRNWPYIPNIAANKIVKADLALTDPHIVSLPSGTTRLLNATGFLFVYHTLSDKAGLPASLEWEAALIDFINNEIKPHASKDMVDSARQSQLTKEKKAYDATHLTYQERQAYDPSLTQFNDHDWSDYQVFVNAQRSWQDELGRSTSLDARLMRDYCLAYLIIATYMIVVNRTNNLVSSKSICGWVGSLSALFGFCVGGGFCYWMGLRHTPTMHASPFLVLAIGLDNTFVVLNFYTLAHSYKEQPKERCAMSLANAGISITITTFTSIISFLVGAAGPYLAVRNFCYVTAMGLLGGYIMNLVFFFPFLCLESVAESENRPLFFPIPTFIQSRLPCVAFRAEPKLATGSHAGSQKESLPTTEDCTRGDPFLGRMVKSNPAGKLAFTMPGYSKKRGLTPPTSPRSGQPNRIQRLYRHRKLMAGFKTGSSSRNSDVFEKSDPEPSSGSSSTYPSSGPGGSNLSFREDLLKGRSIFELASIRWRYNRRHSLIKKEMLRRRLLDPKTGDVKCPNFVNGDALMELAEHGHIHVLTTEPATIPDVLLPSVYCVARFTAEASDEPDGTVGKVSRGVFLNVLGPALCKRRVQCVMMMGLLLYMAVSIFGAMTYLSAGLDLENLTPPDSYLREAFQLSHDKFPIFPYETNLFFTAPDIAHIEDGSVTEKKELLSRYGANSYGRRKSADLKPLSADSLEAFQGNSAGMAEQMAPFWHSLGQVQWWEPKTVLSYIEIDKRLRQMKTTQDVLNGLLLFYNENAQRLFHNATMTSEDRRFVFHGALYRWLKSGVVGQHVRDQFRFADPDPQDPQKLPRLLGVRLIIFNYNFLNSFEQSKYMVEIRQACADVSRDWNRLLLDPADIPKKLQQHVQSSTLQSKGKISDPVFNLPRAPPPQYPVIPNHVDDLVDDLDGDLDDDLDDPADASSDRRLGVDKDKTGFTAVPFMETFLFFESDITILKSTIINMSTAFVAIVLVSSLLMRGVGTAALVTAMICLVDLGIVGFMGLWNIHLNILSMILLVLSIGFSVDYTVHVVHTFTHCLGQTRRDKMAETLILMCNPVTHGAISTFLGILPIVFRKEFVMETFFKMTVLVVAFGFLNGVVFLPVILAIRGPVFNSTKRESRKLHLDVEAATKNIFQVKQ